MINPLPYNIALISLLLYSLLSFLSFYYYYLLFSLQRKRTDSFSDYNILPGEAKFIQSKQLFFLCLGISALLDIPLYIGCIVMQGPEDCEWNALSYSICWTIHRIALAGYFISLGIPLIQWTDVIYIQDDNIISKINSRRFLFISTVCYCLLQFISAIAILIFNIQNPDTFATSQFEIWSGIFESIFLVCNLMIWLWCGIRLQLYVMRVCFRPEAERKIIFTVNVVMFAILLSYLLRAIMVMSLSFAYCDYYVCHYTVWMIGTRWLPYVFCSFLLIYIMRRSTESNTDSKAVLDISECMSTSLLLADDQSFSHSSIGRTTMSSSRHSKRGSDVSNAPHASIVARDRRKTSNRNAIRRSSSAVSSNDGVASSRRDTNDNDNDSDHTRAESENIDDEGNESNFDDTMDGDGDDDSQCQSDISYSTSSHSTTGHLYGYPSEQYHILPQNPHGYSSEHSVTSIISFLNGSRQMSPDIPTSNHINPTNSQSIPIRSQSDDRDREYSRSSLSSFKQFFMQAFGRTPSVATQTSPSPQPASHSRNVSRASGASSAVVGPLRGPSIDGGITNDVAEETINPIV